MSLMTKYRPKTFDDVIGQGVVAEVLRNQSRFNALKGLYILTGHFGGGKTTLARLIMKAANCEDKDERGNPCGVCEGCQGSPLDMMEVDAGQTSGVDDIRKIIEWIGVRPVGRKKVLIIDEVHLLSRQAVSALLKTLEEPPEYLVIVLCTTEEDAIPDTIMSRSAQRFSLGAVPEELLKGHILKIAGLEGIQITEGAAALLAKRSEGAVRNALGLLEQVNVGGEVTEETVQSILGAAHDDVTFHMLDAVIGEDLKEAINALEESDGYGIELGSFLKDVERANADCIKAAYRCPVTGTEGYVREVSNILSRHGLEALISAADLLQKLKQEIRLAATKEAFITTLAACSTRPEKEAQRRAAALEKRVEALEKAAASGWNTGTSSAVRSDAVDIPKADRKAEETPPAPAVKDVEEEFVPAAEEDGIPFDEDPPAAEASEPEAEKAVPEEPAPVQAAAAPVFDPFAMMLKMANAKIPGRRTEQKAVQKKEAPVKPSVPAASAPAAAPVKPPSVGVQKPAAGAAEAQKQLIEKSAETRQRLEEALCQDLDLYREMEGKYKYRASAGKLRVILSDPCLVGKVMYLVTTFGLSSEVEVVTE